MLQLLDFGRPDVLAYRTSGVLTDDDVHTATEAFDRVLKGRPTVHLYAEVENLGGVEIRALWTDLVYGLRHIGDLRHIGRVAVVTDVGWLRRVAETEALLLPVGTLHTYPMEERDDARAWIRDAPREEVLTQEEVASWFGPGDYNIIGARTAWFDERGWRRTQAPPRQRRPHAPRFGHTIHSTHTLLHAVADRLGIEGTIPAYHALRGVLHALRDRLPASEAADLAAQLTTLVRGVFYEGYHPARAGKANREEFLAEVAKEVRDDAPYDAEAATLAVGGALASSVSDGEWRQVLNALPEEIRELLDAPVPA